jgi:hypothetical protein
LMFRQHANAPTDLQVGWDHPMELVNET